MVILAGLSGGPDNLYIISAVREATKMGLKCVVVNYRGSSYIELTSPKLYCGASWKDVQEPIEYIYEKHVKGKTGKHLFGYGVSLGANILTLYMEETGEKCPLKAAVLYANPYDADKNYPYFVRSCYGLYNYVFAFKLRENVYW